MWKYMGNYSYYKNNLYIFGIEKIDSELWEYHIDRIISKKKLNGYLELNTFNIKKDYVLATSMKDVQLLIENFFIKERKNMNYVKVLSVN